MAGPRIIQESHYITQYGENSLIQGCLTLHGARDIINTLIDQYGGIAKLNFQAQECWGSMEYHTEVVTQRLETNDEMYQRLGAAEATRQKELAEKKELYDKLRKELGYE